MFPPSPNPKLFDLQLHDRSYLAIMARCMFSTSGTSFRHISGRYQDQENLARIIVVVWFSLSPSRPCIGFLRGRNFAIFLFLFTSIILGFSCAFCCIGWIWILEGSCGSHNTVVEGNWTWIVSGNGVDISIGTYSQAQTTILSSLIRNIPKSTMVPVDSTVCQWCTHQGDW